MTTSNQLLLLGVLSALSSAAGAVDTSQWKCESCKFEQGVSGTVEVGVGSVSEKSEEFGQYNGLHEKGGFLIGGGTLRSRGEDGAYWNIDASNLGLDTRAVDAEGGKQGSYKLRFKYDESIHRIWDKALTPFSGSGAAALTLPAGFVKAGTTGAMKSLAGSLQSVEMGTQRKLLGLGASWNRSSEWEYAVNFRHEKREGSILRTGGAFFVNSAQLIDPVDYVTDQVDASASYAGKKFQLKLAYYGSKFRNDNHALTWENPFTQVPLPPPVFPDMGQLALPPDNQFHQVLATAGYQFNDKTRLSADIALGRMTQNDNFLPYAIGAPGLPGGSVNARAATLDAALKLSSALTDRLRLNAAYTHNDRDNQTPQAAYNVVTTDMPTFVGPARTNLPYSFTQDKLKLSADYRASAKLRGSVGADFDAHKRTFADVNTTREHGLGQDQFAPDGQDRCELEARAGRAQEFGFVPAHRGNHPAREPAAAEIQPGQPHAGKRRIARRFRRE